MVLFASCSYHEKKEAIKGLITESKRNNFTRDVVPIDIMEWAILIK